MRPKVYISGPLTSSGTPEDNVDCAIEWMHRLIQDGLSPMCPHLSWYVDSDETYTHEEWMELDIAWVDVADCVLRIPGDSIGADIEVDYAETHGIPVFTAHSYGDLVFSLLGEC
tara:strand:+ start:9282 stop:9623 length:342 start_codon:yes stop_codon:yes gene_type:complete